MDQEDPNSPISDDLIVTSLAEDEYQLHAGQLQNTEKWKISVLICAQTQKRSFGRNLKKA